MAKKVSKEEIERLLNIPVNLYHCPECGGYTYIPVGDERMFCIFCQRIRKLELIKSSPRKDLLLPVIKKSNVRRN